MGIRDWINGLRQVPAPGPATDQQLTRWRKALSDFGYPYDVVSGSTVSEAFASAKSAADEGGFVPVVLVPGHWNSRKRTSEARCRRAQELLRAVGDGRQFLADRLLVMYDDLKLDAENPDPDQFDELESKESEAVSTGVSIANRYVAEQAVERAWNQVAIVRVPAASSDELPAYFEWGGWNAVPSTEMIVAVAGHWKQTYGSELVAMGPDLLEFHVSRRPADHATAVALLKEHYVFAPDGFEFDRESLERAAAHLRASTSWVFWWD
jgi:Domain of unknown function (DUF4253)